MARNFLSGGTVYALQSSPGYTPWSSATVPLSFGAWVNIASSAHVDNVNAYCLCGGSAGQQWSIWMNYTTQTISFGHCAGGGPNPAATSTGTIALLVWSHLLVVLSSTTAYTIYLNGVSIGSGTYTKNWNFNSSSPQVGNSTNSGFPLGGSVADFCVWTAALTSSEAQALSQGVRPYRIRNAAISNWWPLDGVRYPEPDLAGAITGNGNTFPLNAFGGAQTPPLSFGPPFMPLTPRWPQGVESATRRTLQPQIVT